MKSYFVKFELRDRTKNPQTGSTIYNSKTAPNNMEELAADVMKSENYKRGTFNQIRLLWITNIQPL